MKKNFSKKKLTLIRITKDYTIGLVIRMIFSKITFFIQRKRKEIILSIILNLSLILIKLYKKLESYINSTLQ